MDNSQIRSHELAILVIVCVQLASIKQIIVQVVLVAQLIGLDGTVITHVLLSISWIRMVLTVLNAIPIVVFVAKHLQIVRSVPYLANIRLT